uniref:MANSC domain-containing protein n=1 Tax=Musca domestica TaxID=7370 RepID=A0A1I8MV57_MUSDO
MIKSPTSTLTIVFLILMKNVQHWSTHATKEVVNLDTLYDDKMHHLAKRMDLQVCLGQFDVHKNTIIRTGESQAIGGKYLQGLELDTMEECQRLCCETESCDVYIFESKKDGYCYLFECGTPENFHCKFTRHANYTSAVLTPVIRSTVEVTTPHPVVAHKTSSAISQQEWELSNLKMKPEVREKAAEMGLPALGVMNTNTNAKKSVVASSDVEVTNKVNSSVQCGRFQFACHSGECIAVYNACDGIPQCEDGSDEGPECSGANANTNNLTPSSKSSSDTQPNKASPQMTQYQSQAFMQQSAQQQLQNMQQIQPSSHQSQSAGVMPSVPVVNNREDPTVWETRKIVSGTPINVNNANVDLQNMNPISPGGNVALADGFTAYINNRQTAAATHGMYAPATSSDGSVPIANVVGGNSGGSTLEQSGLYVQHVTGGGQDPNGLYVQQQQQQQQHILLPPPPPPPPAPLNSNWQQQAILNQQKQQQQGLVISPQQQHQQQIPLPQGSAYAMSNDGSTQQQQSQPVASIMMQQQQQQTQQQPAQLSVPSLSQQQQQLQALGETKSSVGTSNHPSLTQIAKADDSDEYDVSEEKSTEPPKKHKHKKGKSKSKDLDKSAELIEEASASQHSTASKTTSNSVKTIKTAVSPVHEQYEIIHQNMALEFRDHDGQSERPGGAVLSLTLG